MAGLKSGRTRDVFRRVSEILKTSIKIARPGHGADATVADESIAAWYREIYIHSKLLPIGDGFFTLGSTSLNLRSMAVDAEINVGSDDRAKSTDLRRRVWNLHTGGKHDGSDGSPVVITETFMKWQKLMDSNARRRKRGLEPAGFLMAFQDDRTSSVRLA